MNNVVGIQLKADSSGLIGELRTTEGQVVRFASSTQKAGKEARTTSTHVNTMAAASGRLTTTLRSTFSAQRLVAGGFASIVAALGLRQLIAYSDEMTNLRNQLKLVTGSNEELTETQTKLLSLANNTRADLSATGELYARLSRSTKELSITQGQLLGVTRAINQSYVISGASAQEAAGSTRQLSQALASGTFRGDEFNSVAEQSPRLMQALADETGKTTGELRKMAEQGQLTSELLVRALVNQSATINSEFGKTEATISQSTTVLSNNVKSIIGNFNETTGASTSLANGILVIADAFGTVNGFIASGQMIAYLDAIKVAWQAWGTDVTHSINTTLAAIKEAFGSELKAIGDESLSILDFIKEALLEFPQNVRAMVQILAVEFASLLDVGREYGTAFAQVVGVELAKMVQKAGIYGQELADIMAFWDGDTFDASSALAKADEIAIGMTDNFFKQAQKQVEISRNARLSSIEDIVKERDTALESFNKQIAAAQALATVKGQGQSAANDDNFNVETIATPTDSAQGGGENVTDSQIQKLRESFLTREETLKLHLIRRQELINNALLQEKITENEAISLSEESNKQYLDRLQAFNAARSNLILNSSGQIFGALSGLARTFSGEQSKAFKVMFAVQKGFAIAQGVLNLSTAISNAFALPFPANIPAIATATATGTSLLANIKGTQYQGQAHDGLRRVEAANEGTYTLRKDEMVLNPKQRENFEKVVEQTTQTGSGRIAANAVVNFNPTIQIDATNAMPGMEEKIKEHVMMGLDEYDAMLQEDFANNGTRSALLSGVAA